MEPAREQAPAATATSTRRQAVCGPTTSSPAHRYPQRHRLQLRLELEELVDGVAVAHQALGHHLDSFLGAAEHSRAACSVHQGAGMRQLPGQVQVADASQGNRTQLHRLNQRQFTVAGRTICPSLAIFLISWISFFSCEHECKGATARVGFRCRSCSSWQLARCHLPAWRCAWSHPGWQPRCMPVRAN